jgi:predicted enzyme related to lactoylglutathione lyase
MHADGRIEMWVGSQDVFYQRDVACRRLGMNEDKVLVHGCRVGGALAKGNAYKPSKDGAIIYFDVPDIDVVLRNAKQRGSKILYEKKDIGEAGFVAEFEDSEGNRVALSQVRS